MQTVLKILFSLCIVTLPLVYSFQTYQVFEVNKFFIQCVFTAFISIGFAYVVFKNPQKFFPSIPNFFLLLFGVGIFFLLGSVYFSQTPIIALLGGAERHQGVLFWVHLFVIGFVASRIFTKKDISIFIVSPLVLVGVVLTFHTLVQWKSEYFEFFSFLHSWAFFEGQLSISSVSGRPFATMGQPNFLAQALLFPFAAVGYGILQWGKEKNFFGAFLFLILLGSMGTAIWATGSRAGLLGALVIIFLLASVGLEYWIGKKIVLWAVVIVLGSVVTVWGVIYFFPELITDHLGERGRSVLARHYFWNEGARLIPQYFFFGVGGDNLHAIFQEFGSKNLIAAENFTAIPGRAHTVLLDIPLHFGVPFFFLLLFGIYKSFQKIFLQKFSLLSGLLISASIGLIVAWSFGFGVTTDFTFLAIFIGLIWAGGNHKRAQKNFSQGGVYLATVFFVLFGFISLGIGIITWQADKAYYLMSSSSVSYEENKSLWAQIKRAPWLESNILSSDRFLSSLAHKELMILAEKYSYRSFLWWNIQISEYREKGDTELSRKIFFEAFQKTGNHVVKKIQLLAFFQQYLGTNEESLTLAKSIYEIIPPHYFDEENFSNDIWVKKFWKDSRFTSVYSMLDFMAKSSPRGNQYCGELQSVYKSFGFSYPIPEQCLPLKKSSILQKTIAGRSMEPMLQDGQKIFLDLEYYTSHTPQKGDLVAYDYGGNKHPLIKKIIATGNDTVELRDGVLYVNTQEVKNSIGARYIFSLPQQKMLGLYISDAKKIPENSYFILGDNISNSIDSRNFGAISGKNFLGRFEQ